MTKEAYRYTRVDRTFDYFALLLIGLMGWMWDRLPAREHSYSQNRRFHESSR
jgi:hypothetical protein